jgi:uncharacterized protein (DUF169 family)
MIFSTQDLAVLSKLNLSVKPIAIGLFLERPNGIDRLDENMRNCEMFKKVRERGPFYTDLENHKCDPALFAMGMKDLPPTYESGERGTEITVFKEPRIARRLYSYVPTLKKNTVNYIAFSTLENLNFRADILLLAADTNQAEILLRATNYTTGHVWSSKVTPVLGCAWIIVYPYVTGEVNYVIPSFCAGMREFRIFPEGFVVVGMPFELVPSLLRNLEEMPVALPRTRPVGSVDH